MKKSKSWTNLLPKWLVLTKLTLCVDRPTPENWMLNVLMLWVAWQPLSTKYDLTKDYGVRYILLPPSPISII